MNYHISLLDIIGITVSLIIVAFLACLRIHLWFKYKNKKTIK
jgi:hypothetical protein